MATSLWELRKRLLPNTAMTSPSPTKAPSKLPPIRMPKIRAPAPKPAPPTPPTPTAILPCRYVRGTCSRPRAFKSNGKLHSLCELHRDRSRANQRRFDDKKRQEKREMGDAQYREAKEQRKQRREKRRRQASGALDASPSPSVRASQEPPTMAPPIAARDVQATATTSTTPSPRRLSSADLDATGVWLFPFPSDKAAEGASDGAGDARASDAAWRRAAVAQFLQDA